jgi:small-conductance mechanosensitive channel
MNNNRTTAFAPDGRLVVIPNVVMCRTAIYNWKRTSKYTLTLTFQIVSNTLSADVRQLEVGIREWLVQDVVETPWEVEQASFWISRLVGGDFEVNVSCPIKCSHHDFSTWSRARSRLLLKISELCQELSLVFYPVTARPTPKLAPTLITTAVH